MNGRFIITIVSDNKKGLLNQITAIFNKRNFAINSISISTTNVANIILITLEALLHHDELKTTLNKIEKIIEVYKVLSFAGNEARLRMASLFKVSIEILNNDTLAIFKKYNVRITHINEDSLILEKLGSEEEITELSNLLDSPHLLSFCKTTLPFEKGLIDFNNGLS